jgi:protein CpxP
MRRSLIGIALAVSLLGTAAARAEQASTPSTPPAQGDGPGRWGGPGGPGGGPEGGLHGIFRQLDLTADQKTQLKALREQRQPADKAAHRDVKEAQRAFAQLLLSGNASDDALRAAQSTLSQKREADAAARFEGLLEVRRILTADQRAKFDHAFIEMRHEQHQRGPQQ